jgi:hypothetical protein
MHAGYKLGLLLIYRNSINAPYYRLVGYLFHFARGLRRPVRLGIAIGNFRGLLYNSIDLMHCFAAGDVSVLSMFR